MIDLSLSKLALIGIVALVVIGPESLPKVARMAGALFGRARRYFNEIRSEVSHDFSFDELHAVETTMRVAVHDMENGIMKNRTSIAADSGHSPDAAKRIENAFLPGYAAAKARHFRSKKREKSSAHARSKQRQGGICLGSLRTSRAAGERSLLARP